VWGCGGGGGGWGGGGGGAPRGTLVGSKGRMGLVEVVRE